MAPVTADDLAAGFPPELASGYELLPPNGHAVELACGRGHLSLVLAHHGLSVVGYDVSDVAIDLARQGAEELGLSDRCRFVVADLDDGLVGTDRYDVMVCNRFWADDVAKMAIERVVPDGLLMITALSEVGGTSGRFRLGPGALLDALQGAFSVERFDEDHGITWFIGRRLP